MPESPTASTAPQPDRLKTTNTLMALVILLLLGQVAWQPPQPLHSASFDSTVFLIAPFLMYSMRVRA